MEALKQWIDVNGHRPTVLDRALSLQAFRNAWEQEHGPVQRGGDRISVVAVKRSSQGEASFHEHAAYHAGISIKSAQRLMKIARGITPEMIEAIRGFSIADNQQALLKLSKLDREKQTVAARAIRGEADIEAYIY